MQPLARTLCTVLTCLAAALPLSSQAALFGLGGPSDYAKLEGFSDPALEKGSSTQVFKDQKPRASAFKANEMMGAGFGLSEQGLAKVHINSAVGLQGVPDGKGYLGYGEGYFEVSVGVGDDPTNAKDLQWEIWDSESQSQMHSAFGSTSITFKKLMGPFKANEMVKLPLVKSATSDSYGFRYTPRAPLIVVYSPSEPTKRFAVVVYASKPN